MRQHLRLLGMAAMLTTTSLPAQQQHYGPPRFDPAVAAAVRAAPAAPAVDGVLDDAAWQTAPVITGFVQRDPNEGEPATEQTEVRVVYTDDAVYVGIQAYDSEPDRITAQLTRRDVDSPSDWLLVGFDSYHDRRTGFAFAVNPAGVKRDFYLFDDNNDDDSWDAVWDVACARNGEGWAAEFRIPFSQLRFARAEEQRWGFQVVRVVSRLNEESHWRLMPKDESGIVSRFGELAGIHGIAPPRRVEILPYVAASAAFAPEVAGDPFRTGSDGAGRGGADVNVGITSNLTLSATINPDFGQVEADPAVVNLSAFETFFPERRPFFNEGIDVFRFPLVLGDGGAEQVFYTRRIGRRPQASPDDRGGYAEDVRNTTILGAAKVSGKTPTGWTVGLLTALTAEEEAEVVDPAGTRFRDVVEPRSTYVVGRLAKDFRSGHSQVGVFGTAVNRALPEELSFLHRAAYAGGIDWSHRWRNDTYNVHGWFVASHVRGAPEALEETQRSPARYFQRPDNEHTTLDPGRTSLSGFAVQFIVEKHAGGAWRFATGVDTRSPGFEVNDAGFQQEADRTIQFLWINRRWLEPGKVFRRFHVNFNQYSSWSYGWERLGLGGNVNANWTFRNYWGGFLGVEHNFSVLRADALRGGPAFLRPNTWNGWGGFGSDDRKALRGGAEGFFYRQPASDSWGFEVGPYVSWRPASNMDFTFAPSVFRQHDTWQYLETSSALGEDHYLFGDLRQTTLNVTFRGNVTFTPTLSLQLWAQPFISSGDYIGIRRVAEPRAEQFADRFDDLDDDRLVTDGGAFAADLDRDGVIDIDVGNPDFTVLSFRSNVVLRWEYLLGSTLFVVWQHGRFDVMDRGRFRLGRSLDDLFEVDAENRFVVKLNYWISL